MVTKTKNGSKPLVDAKFRERLTKKKTAKPEVAAAAGAAAALGVAAWYETRAEECQDEHESMAYRVCAEAAKGCSSGAEAHKAASEAHAAFVKELGK